MLDVLVIGSGLAGVTAALAAKARGMSVGLASGGWGATALSTGGFDIAYSPALSPVMQIPRTLMQHIDDIIAHRRRHPYGVLGHATTLAGLRQGAQLLSQHEELGFGAWQHFDENAENRWLPSTLGVLAPVAMCGSAHQNVDWSGTDNGLWKVLSIDGLSSFNAARLMQGWQYDCQRLYGHELSLEAIQAAWPLLGQAMPIAKAMDSWDGLLTWAAGVKPALDNAQGVIVPPVFGLQHSQKILQQLAECWQRPVVEALAHMPSVPGWRLQHRLDAIVQHHQWVTLGEVKRIERANGVIDCVECCGSGRVAAKAYVLATGRFISGGIQWQNDHCCEPLLGLEVVTEAAPLVESTPLRVVRRRPVASHPLMTAGLRVDAALQPQLGEQAAYANLFAAGMVIGGFASRYALCADGVALATGYFAGDNAANLVQQGGL